MSINVGLFGYVYFPRSMTQMKQVGKINISVNNDNKLIQRQYKRPTLIDESLDSHHLLIVINTSYIASVMAFIIINKQLI